MLVVEVITKGIEALAEERSELVYPTDHILQRSRMQPIEAMAAGFAELRGHAAAPEQCDARPVAAESGGLIEALVVKRATRTR